MRGWFLKKPGKIWWWTVDTRRTWCRGRLPGGRTLERHDFARGQPLKLHALQADGRDGLVALVEALEGLGVALRFDGLVTLRSHLLGVRPAVAPVAERDRVALALGRGVLGAASGDARLVEEVLDLDDLARGEPLDAHAIAAMESSHGHGPGAIAFLQQKNNYLRAASRT